MRWMKLHVHVWYTSEIFIDTGYWKLKKQGKYITLKIGIFRGENYDMRLWIEQKSCLNKQWKSKSSFKVNHIFNIFKVELGEN